MFGGGQQPNTPFGSTSTFGQPQQQQTNTAPAFGAPAGGGIFGGGSPAPAAPFGGGFGAAPAPSAFGAPAPSAFGAPAPFGAPNPAPAPTGGLFGQQPAATPFGANPAPAPGGLFGQQPAPAPFGASPAPAPGGLFGQPTPAPFGAPAPAPAFGGFGTTPAPAPFGAPAPAPTGGLFGQQPAPATAFGAAPAPGLFGQQPAPAPTGFGGFGAPAPAPATGGFGAPAPAAGGLFGSPATPATGGPGGTRGSPFQVTTLQDNNTTLNMQSISAMPQYNTKTFEELRFEDYSQGNRGTSTPTATNVGGGFGFGAPANAPAPTGGLFGSTAPAPTTGFGGTTPGPAPGGLFGQQPAPAPTAFGAPAPPGGLFGAAPTPAFGASPAPAPAAFGTGGAFGAKPVPAPSAFGAPTPAFGSPAPAPGGLFGQQPAPAPFGTNPAPAPGGLFGQQPAPAPFGTSPAPAPGGLFGQQPAPAPFGAPAPTPAFGGFGTTPAPAPFGAAPAPTGGLFGQQPAQAPGFGAAPAPGGLFGQQPAPAPGGFGGFGAAPAPFGSPAPAPFGAPMQQQAAPPQAQALFPLHPNAQIIAPAAQELLEQRMRAMDNQMKELKKMDVWRGGSPSKSPTSTPTSMPESDTFFSPGNRSAVVPYTPQSGAKIRPRGFPKSEPRVSTAAFPSSESRRDNSSMMSPEGHARSSQLKLYIHPDSLKKAPRNFGLKIDDSRENGLPLPTESVDPVPTEESEKATPKNDRNGGATIHAAPSPHEAQNATVSSTIGEPATSPGYEYYQKVVGSTDQDAGQSTAPITNGHHAASPSLVPTLTKTGYEVSPSLEELAKLSEADLACVKNFAVKRPGYGMVEWEGTVDVRGADLDRIVVIDKHDVSVYTQDEEEGTKPEEGTKLNRSAKITFFGVFPKKGAQASEEEKKKFAAKVEKSTKANGAEFILYEDVTGIWKIRVLHFSRYGLLDDDSDEENAMEPSPKEASGASSTPHQFEPLATRKATPFKQTRLVFEEEEVSEDAAGDEDETDLMDAGSAEYDVMMEDVVVHQEAEEAAKSIFDAMQNEKQRHVPVVEDEFTYSDEGEDSDGPSDDEETLDGAVESPTPEDYLIASSMKSFCSHLASSGLCSGRSFRVGWLPDGSFLKIGRGPASTPVLVKARPVLSAPNGFSDTDTLSLIESQRKHSVRCDSGLDGCPIYSLPKRNESTSSSFPRTEALSESFASVECPYEDVKHGFTLVSYLLYADDNKKNQDFPLEARRVAAVYKLLVDLCALKTPLPKSLSEVFAALSTGNIEAACDLAAEAGFTHMSVLLATSSEGRKDVMRLLLDVAESGDASRLSNADYATRILENIAGESKTENALFQGGDKSLDWRRRFVMRLLQDTDKTLLEALQRYESDVASGDVPFPRPCYMSASSSQSKSLFYRLLQFCAGDPSMTLREAIDPSGFTSFLHYFQVPFHLVSAMSSSEALASGVHVTLSELDAEYITDGFMAQLALDGRWDLAVFVSLCSICSETPEVYHRKVERAKALVLRHYNELEGTRQREFLERVVGVPAKWFEEALCYRAASSGNALKSCNHAHGFDSQLVFTSFAEYMIPTLYYCDRAACKSWLATSAHTSPQASLARAMHDFFELEDILMHCASHPEEELSDVEDLQNDLEDLSQFLSEFNDSLRNKSASGRVLPSGNLMVPGPDENVRLTSMMSEVLSRLGFLKVQLACLALKDTNSGILNDDMLE